MSKIFMNKSVLEKIKEDSLYVHIYASGNVFVQNGYEEKGHITCKEGLTLELKEAKKRNAMLYYSLEDLPDKQVEEYDDLVDFLLDQSLDSQMVHPFPQVYGYYKSFVPYMNDALEVAGEDVMGLLEELGDLREEASTIQRGTIPYLEITVKIRKLEEKYLKASLCLEHLAALHSELCLELEEDDLEK